MSRLQSVLHFDQTSVCAEDVLQAALECIYSYDPVIRFTTDNGLHAQRVEGARRLMKD